MYPCNKENFLWQEEYLLWHKEYNICHRRIFSCERKNISCDSKFVFCDKNKKEHLVSYNTFFLWMKEYFLSQDINFPLQEEERTPHVTWRILHGAGDYHLMDLKNTWVWSSPPTVQSGQGPSVNWYLDCVFLISLVIGYNLLIIWMMMQFFPIVFGEIIYRKIGPLLDSTGSFKRTLWLPRFFQDVFTFSTKYIL